MGGENSILDMIIRYRNNMSMLRTTRFNKNQNKFRKARRAYARAAKGKLELTKATPEQIKAVRDKIRRQKRNNTIVLISILLVFMPIISFGIYKMLSGARDSNLSVFDADFIKKKSNAEKVSTYLASGDSLFRLNDWRAAYYFYFQAGKIEPNNYNIDYRLALAKTEECIYRKTGCAESEKRLEELIKTFPDSVDLYQLKISKAYSLGDTAVVRCNFRIVDRLEMQEK